MLVVHNEELLGILRDRYTSADIAVIRKFLHDHDVLTFPQIGDTGLFPAARRSFYTGYTQYDRIWVRDNIHIANAHLLTGCKDIACASLRSLFAMFKAQKDRFDRYISGETDRKELSGRPHVRFQTQDGTQFAFEPWNAQNDALGYFLWFACTLILEGIFAPQPDDIDMLRTFVAFFESITFWSDEDCGHWEESPKIESSSIGTVLAGLNNYRRLLDCFDMDGRSDEKQRVQWLCDTAQLHLNAMLPAECLQIGKRREFDAALLFLIFPLGVVAGKAADKIVERVETHLKGDFGIRRYPGDRFWGPDYDAIVPPNRWTVDTSRHPGTRQRLVAVTPGVDEAQWCIFDPLLSVIYGLQYRSGQSDRQLSLEKQIHYFNRALGQITGPDAGEAAYRCPELYYQKNGRYVHNAATPLLWTQANLMLALEILDENILLTIHRFHQ